MANLKNLSDLLAKMSRNTKERAVIADCTEALRQLKAVDQEWKALNQVKQLLELEVAKLKKEKQKAAAAAAAPAPAAGPATPAGPRAEGFIWKKD